MCLFQGFNRVQISFLKHLLRQGATSELCLQHNLVSALVNAYCFYVALYNQVLTSDCVLNPFYTVYFNVLPLDVKKLVDSVFFLHLVATRIHYQAAQMTLKRVHSLNSSLLRCWTV